jgi:dUTP pyrophosphatase
MTVEVFAEICREGAVLPSYARPGDAGMDVCAAEDTVIMPGQTVVIPTGLKLAVPEGYEIQVRPRSGISLNTPLRLSNSPGTIDSGYRNELGIIMTNCPDFRWNFLSLWKQYPSVKPMT